MSVNFKNASIKNSTISPRIVYDSSLVLVIDPANPKSYDSYENLLSTSIRTTDATGATSDSGWTITANNATAPDGTTTATLLTQSSSLSNFGINWLIGGNSAGQVMSIFCKPVSGSVVIQGQTGNGDDWTANLSTNVFTDDSNGRHANGRVDVYSDGWKRVIIPMFSIPPFDGPDNFPGSSFYLTLQGVGSVLLWGWQRENGSTASTYYPTAGAAKTRGTLSNNLIPPEDVFSLTNGAGYNSTNGGVFTFEGTDEFIESNTSISYSLANGFTLMQWVKLNDYIGGGTYSQNSALLSRGYINFIFQGAKLRWETHSSNSMFSASDVPLNTWTLLTGTMSTLSTPYTAPPDVYGSGTARIYLNGVLNGIPTALVSAPSTNKEITIGAYENTGGYTSCNCSIGQTLFYNRELSATEILQNYNALKFRYGL